jgi:hypothetical protein
MDESTTFGNKRFLVQLMVSGSRTSLKAFTIQKNLRIFINWLNKLVRLSLERYFCPILIYIWEVMDLMLKWSAERYYIMVSNSLDC